MRLRDLTPALLLLATTACASTPPPGSPPAEAPASAAAPADQTTTAAETTPADQTTTTIAAAETTPAAREAAAWAAFAEARRGECVGPPGALTTPLELRRGERTYRLEGHRLVELTADADHLLRIGVLSAIKDDREPTLAAVRTLRGRLEKAGIDVLVVNGDLATNLFELQKVFAALAESPVLVVASIGNTESCGAFNQAAEEVFATQRHVINGNWVRRLELDDGTLVTLPGYYDRRFTHTGGAAHYDAKDLDVLSDLLLSPADATAPVVLISHGPPRGEAKKAIDVVNDGSHVGDAALTVVMKDRRTMFGLFGHILESGGRATDSLGKQPKAAGAWHESLIVNAGSANTDPWTMVEGTTSYGMALRFELESPPKRPARARYAVEKLPAP